MLDLFHLPTSTGDAEVFEFRGTAATTGTGWITWCKPRGKTMANILLLGPGGNGGTGVVGANSTAAGGGGGASGNQVSITIPITFLPDLLFLSIPQAGVGGGAISYVSVMPNTTTNHLLAMSTGGGNGGNASGATAGAAGAAASVNTISQCPLAALGQSYFLAGQAGIIGGTTVAGAALTLPLTGLIVTGGTGGAGLPASAAAGLADGAFTVPAQPSVFPAHQGGLGTSTATVPPGAGERGFTYFNGLRYFYGGTGGGSTHGSATGGGLVQASGGDGAPGCGGGGMGGALTASTAGVVGKGGEGYCLITCW